MYRTEPAVTSPLDNTYISVNLTEIDGIFTIGFATRGIKLCSEDCSDRNYIETQNLLKKMMVIFYSET